MDTYEIGSMIKSIADTAISTVLSSVLSACSYKYTKFCG